MGGTVAVEIGEGKGRAVFLRRAGNVFVLEKAVEEVPDPASLKGREILISYHHPDILIENVEVPPVKDPETLEVLIKKKLSESFELTSDYLIVYRLIEVQKERAVYRVVGVPRSIYEGADIVNEETKLRVKIFAPSLVSLAGISRKVGEELTVFHVFADTERVLITVSRGDEILYARSIPFGGADPESFLLEHVNMTYIFVAQRQNIPIDLILVSGKAKDLDSFLKELSETVQTGIATPVVPKDIRNAAPDRFHSFMVPLGNLYLPEDYDFSPREVRERRWFAKALTRSLYLVYALVLLLLPLLGIRVYEFVRDLRDYEEQKKLLLTRAKAFRAERIVKEGKLDYYRTYADLIYRSRALNPLNILKDAGPLLKEVRASTYTLGSEKGKVYLLLEVDRTFPSLVELTMFRERLMRTLEGLKKSKGLSYKVEREIRDLEGKRLRVSIKVERKV